MLSYFDAFVLAYIFFNSVGHILCEFNAIECTSSLNSRLVGIIVCAQPFSSNLNLLLIQISIECFPQR